MHCIEFPDAKLKRYIPCDLSECDQPQYIDMCELIFDYQNGSISYDEFRTHAVYKLLNMKRKKSKNEFEDEQKFCNVYMISELIDSFFEENKEGEKTIKQYYIHNPVPSFKPVWRTYYGPSDSFMNMTFGEYRDALRLFLDFHATGEANLLYLLSSIFYRPKKTFHFIRKRLVSYDGDIREPYKSHSLEKRADAFKSAPIGFIYGFFLLFASFQKYISSAKIMWGGQEIDFSILFDASNVNKEPSPNQVPGIGMDSIAFSMAESGAFGSMKEVDNTNFWQIMIRMYDLRRTDLEQQKHEANVTN